MSAEARYYYVDAQNQAAGPIAIAGLLALKAAGTVTDATLVVVEGGAEWVAFSTLKPAAAAPVAAVPQPAAALHSSDPAGVRSDGGSSSAAEPMWASQLSQKVDRLVATMERLIVSLEKTRPSSSAPAPATAALHAERANLNVAPKPGIAASTPASITPTAAPGVVPRPNPTPAGTPGAVPRHGLSTPLTPLAVPANAQKSALPLPALGKVPGPAPAALPKPAAPAPAPAKGNIFSKFLKK